jgi:hypothetical protein
MTTKLFKFTFLIFLFFAFEQNYAQTLVVPPAPGDLSSVEHLFQSDDYTVEVRKTGDVNYISCFVYKSDNYWTGQYINLQGNLTSSPPRIPKSASFTNVSFLDTSIDVRVTFKNTITSATIRPLNFGVTPEFSGKVLTFTLNEPRKISIEINDRLNPLFLFADTPDVPNTAATYYFAPGTVTNIGLRQITLQSNQSVYIAAGAVVEGSFAFNWAVTGIRIGGRGILSMGEWLHTTNNLTFLSDHSAIRSNSTNNMIIEGITIANGCGWQMPFYNSEGTRTFNNQIRNVKTVSWSGNTDGIWVNGTGHIVDDCFIFNNDDALMSHSASNCKISNIVFWGGQWGRLYWHNNQLAKSENMTFENINVIGKDGGIDLILVDGTSSPSQLNNFTFRNLRVESHTGFSNKFLKFVSGSKSINNWKFENVTIDDVKTDEGDLHNTADSPINGVSFVNLKMGNTFATNLSQAKMSVSTFATNVTFGLAPEIHVKQSTTDIVNTTGSFPFRNVSVNTPKILTFTIQNQGGAALNLTGSTKVVITGTAFSLVTDAPATINADGSATFKVKFEPTAVTSYTGTVTIANSDTDEGTYSFAVTGKGVNTVLSNKDFINEDEAIQCFPNPTKDKVYVELKTTFDEDIQMALYGLDGRKLIQKDVQANVGLNKVEFDLQSLPNGMYLLKTSSNEKPYKTIKIAVQH